MTTTHPFAEFIEILGRGKNGSRSLSFDEAWRAMTMVMRDEVEAVQLGAFLMLLRVKEESPEELAGFARAARQALPGQPPTGVQLDWPSYAGKRRQLPWFVLSAQLLAHNGIPVFMHGSRGRKPDRIYTEQAITALGLPVCMDFAMATTEIARRGFAYVPLQNFAPRLQQIMDLRALLGLRSPINTLLRVLNPSDAPYLLQSTFHPNYREIHQQTALLLRHPHMAVFKGESGEIERDPDRECDVYAVHNEVATIEHWPPMFAKGRHLKDEKMDITRLAALWRGDIDDEYGTAAVIGTTAIVLRLLQRAAGPQQALQQAGDLWQARPRQHFD
ncbi:MAG: glycosyl transferase family protein [Gammaproteobacteria bacterium]|nr:glycosyl transferase family protein [Gammaproteobacteria bacterium]